MNKKAQIFKKIIYAVLILGISGFIFFHSVQLTFAQPNSPRENTWVTDSGVNSIVTDGNTVYLGGDFTYVGPHTGGGVPISTSSGAPISPYFKVNGQVETVISDGSGGWYIGGSFTKVGEVERNNIAHILSDGSVNPDWNPNADNGVYTLALDSSNSILYVGGYFENIGGEERNNIAALNTSTGNATDWNPNADGMVNTLALDSSNSILYVGGWFTSIGGQTRNNIAALNTSTGNATDWNPNVDNGVYTLALDSSNSILYVGGGFTSIGENFRQSFAQFGPITIQFTQSDSQGLENITPVSLEIGLSETDTLNVSVDYTAIGGTAIQGTDYVLANGTATILAGNTTTTIEVGIIDDEIDESDETIFVSILNPHNAKLGTNTNYTYTILDNEEPTTPPTTTPPTTTPPAAPAAGGSGAQSQIQNLIEIGNYEYACQIINQWPGLLSQSEKERICRLAASEEKPISEMTLDELNAQIAVLRVRIAELQSQLAKLLGKQTIGAIGVYPEIPVGFKFERNLRLGMTGNDVKHLQIILNSDPDTRLAVSGIGSSGHETNYFGVLTQTAVIKFQEKYASEILAPWNLTKGTGVVANTTRAKLNQILGF